MRLRYLHLTRYGPLVDISFVFGQEQMLYGWSPTDNARRRGAINFVVGVNGTGKSTLLRAVYQTFRALKQNDVPAHPVTLAWDRTIGGERVTALLKVPSGAAEAPWFAVIRPVAENATEEDWRVLVRSEGRGSSANDRIHFVGNGDPITTSLLQAYLPTRLVAYTSGTEMLWDRLEQSSFHPEVADDDATVAGDRPPGWTIEREWEEERPVRIANVLARLARNESRANMSGEDLWHSIKFEEIRLVIDEMEPLARIRRGVLANQLVRSGRSTDFGFRTRQTDIRLAAISLALWQAARDLRGKNAEADRDSLRRRLLDQKKTGALGDDARRVFNQLDWFWPTHLSLTYHDSDEPRPSKQREQLLCLQALADEVVQQPLGRHRAVISLGPIESIDLQGLREMLLPGLATQSLELTVDRVEGCTTGAEAVMRVFSDNEDLDATLIEFFYALREWQASGLLDDITLTIKRLSRPAASDGEPDDAIVTYDQLSDGEQMLLGRVALLFLLRRQHGTLLLLDEPETHFNDVWKREMIDLVDEGILKTTDAQVVVATHTSIALSDVFASEIVLLRRDPATGQPYEALEPIETFGATPEDILRDIFQADEVIGQRAAQILDLVLIVAANSEDAAVVWASGEFSGPAVQTLWGKAQHVPHSFQNIEEFSQFLASIWSFTRAQRHGAIPTLVDTLNLIENKLGPGHYQFEFRRRIQAQTIKDNAPPH